MIQNLQRSFLLVVGLLFCLAACQTEQSNIIRDNGETTAAETSFNSNLMPILANQCAVVGCHVTGNPPHEIDFSTFETFIRGGDEGAIFRPGDAQNSEIIEEIESGKMPPDGPPLPAAQIQLFKDWINQQDPADFPDLRYHDDDDHDDDDDDDN